MIDNKTLNWMVLLERFGFHSTAVVLPLFLASPLADGGAGMRSSTALALTGLYLAAMQIGALVGGRIGDRVRDGRLLMGVGGLVTALGYAILATPGLVEGYRGVPIFYCATLLAAAGAALQRPALLVRAGARGYGRLFIVINVGGTLAAIVSGALGEAFGWRLSIAFSAVAMLVTSGLALRLVDEAPINGDTIDVEVPRGRALPGLITILVASTLFAAALAQAGGLISLFAYARLDREVLGFVIPTTWFAGAQPLAVLLLAPVLLSTVNTPLGQDPWRAAMRRFFGGFALAGSAFIGLAICVQVDAALIGALLCNVLLAAGELYFAPNAMAAVSALAPPEKSRGAMGAYLATGAVGSGLGGLAGAILVDAAPIIVFAAFGGALFAAAAIAGIAGFTNRVVARDRPTLNRN
jgi:POT family proton-dependent oligopeptide transporter